MTLDEVRRALARVNDATPPNSEKNQQMKDSLLWEACVSLSEESDVYLVTNDGGFFKDKKKEDSPLAEPLSSEPPVVSGHLRVFRSLENAMNRFAPDFSAERVDVPEIDLDKVISEITAVAFRHSEMVTNRGIEVDFRGVIPEFFKTSESHRFSVSFTAFFAVVNKDGQEAPGKAVVAGDLIFDTRKPAVENVNLQSIAWTFDPQGEWRESEHESLYLVAP